MIDEAAFLTAIRADPGAGAHLIFADWLDEHGRPALADALRGKRGQPIAWALSRQPLLDADGVLALLDDGWAPAYWPGFAAFVRLGPAHDEYAVLSLRSSEDRYSLAEAAWEGANATRRVNFRRLFGRPPETVLFVGRDARPVAAGVRVVDRFRLLGGSPAGEPEVYPAGNLPRLFPPGADLSEPPALWVPAAPAWGGLQVGLQANTEPRESAIKWPSF